MCTKCAFAFAEPRPLIIRVGDCIAVKKIKPYGVPSLTGCSNDLFEKKESHCKPEGQKENQNSNRYPER